MTPNDLAQSRAPIAIGQFWSKLWMRIALQGAVLVGSLFLAYEVVERVLLLAASPATLHALHLVRGVGTAFLLGTWSFLNIRKARLECDMHMQDDLQQLETRVRNRTTELEEARAFTELLFNSLRERIIVLDREGRVVKANRVALEAGGAIL